MWAAGASVAAIARAHGVSRNVMGGLMRRNRKEFPRRTINTKPAHDSSEDVVKKRISSRQASNRANLEEAPPIGIIEVKESEPVLLIDRSARQCAFPLWGSMSDPIGPDEQPFNRYEDRYCGAPTKPGRSYCDRHRQIMIRPEED